MFLTVTLATFLISLVALIGALTLTFNAKKLHQGLIFLVSLSAGTMLGGAFLHLLPEALENLDPVLTLSITLASYLVFLFIENFLHWHHSHLDESHEHSFGYMNLLGDGIHNFIDGMIIASAFLTDTRLGVITAIAVALHELPQEISDFGVLMHAGLNKVKALQLNFLVALCVVLGGWAGLALANSLHSTIPFLLPVAAGAFIYIASSDLVPQIKNHGSLTTSLRNVGVMLLGIGLMILIGMME